ncbi:CTD kinase subunit gamma CTK3-domain-containing protein [Crepidotus variabilis]|uniref:CTD kinase subunit gamma CTK3-domain-containing protein n=1 Tax=Crepidotus variabilis TaxID=179855 RepID=A0A9P6E9S9_9AGAR|nr:CTD kinase subunit gamma CTK3-domain-containing protein [Crepidotus variabilis]
MDPFEVRMQFIEHLRRLNASQQSIQKVVGFAVKYFPPCGEDIWDCIVEESAKGSINSRINILYFLDTLCETSLLVKSHSRSEKSRNTNANGLYVQFIARDLERVVRSIVPEGKQGLPNLVNTKQILENWRSKRYIDPQRIDDMLGLLDTRPIAASSDAASTASSKHHSPPHQPLSRNDVTKRIEQDRERHKRLRERRWVQPTLHNPASFQPPQLACFYPLTEPGEGQEELALDIEFENEWETTSDWNEDDVEAIGEEAELAFPVEVDTPMQTSSRSWR